MARRKQPKRKPLTDKQFRFVIEYLKDQDAGKAAIRAGYSRKTAYTQGPRLFRIVQVRRAVDAMLAKVAKSSEVTAEQVLEEIRRVAFSRLSDVVEWGPDGARVKDASELTPEVLAAVASVRDHTSQHTRTVSVKMHDKVGALMAFARHLNCFEDDNKSARGLTIIRTVTTNYKGPGSEGDQ